MNFRSRRNSASYEYVSITDDIITIRDLDGLVSVTNDAENVVKEVIRCRGERNDKGKPWRIQYYDTMGNLDELMHEEGSFRGFRPVQTEGRAY